MLTAEILRSWPGGIPLAGTPLFGVSEGLARTTAYSERRP